MTHLESLVELGLSSTFSTILTQCSLDIFKVKAFVSFPIFHYLIYMKLLKTCIALLSQVALGKVFNFATTNIFETRVAGRMVADMCRAASKVSSLRLLLLGPNHQFLVAFYFIILILAVRLFSVSPCGVAQSVCAALLQYHKPNRCQ